VTLTECRSSLLSESVGLAKCRLRNPKVTSQASVWPCVASCKNTDICRAPALSRIVGHGVETPSSPTGPQEWWPVL
jgi:hypothetical protein